MTDDPTEATPERRRPWLRRAFIASQIILGLGLGLAVAEWAFWKRDDGAFPHVNFYEADPELGVRLQPGASMRFRLHDNPTTTIHVNAQGYRGADWPAASPEANDEILVVGDSQVFGLGVEDGETFSARLAEHTGRTVLNAGVPTYGPLEYQATAEAVIAERKPQTLVYVLNFLNDPFELDRPNVDRHVVWDGWAVRAETAPDIDSIRSFPGRRWLYSRSHLFYAARRWWYERETDLANAGEMEVPSEGSWEDLVVDGTRSIEHANNERVAAAADARASRGLFSRLSSIEAQLDANDRELDELIEQGSDYEWDEYQARIARGRPGDIVDDDYSEESRSIVLTAGHIRRATESRQKHLDALLRKEAKRGKHAATELVEQADQLEAEREALRRAIAEGEIVAADEGPSHRLELRRLAATGDGVATGRHPSVFDDHLDALADMCEANGVELVVVALPVDVQVSADEWAKYGVDDPPDMEPSLALLDDLVASARARGARTLDATEALRAAEPGAFLDGDIHMTAKGHAAVAEALAETLGAAPALILPAAGLPNGRTFPPADKQWRPTDEVSVKGSTRAGCTTQIRSDWLRVRCAKPRRRSKAPTGIAVLEGDSEAVLTLVSPDGAALVAPLTVGEPLVARFDWEDHSRELRITWPAGDDGQPTFAGAFVDVEGDGRPLADVAADPDAERIATLCACHRALTGENDCIQQGNGDYIGTWVEDCRPSCRELWGEPSTECFATYAAGDEPDCASLLACAQGDPLSAPRCDDGTIHATARNGCYAPCDGDHPCDAGACTPYNGGGICV